MIKDMNDFERAMCLVKEEQERKEQNEENNATTEQHIEQVNQTVEDVVENLPDTKPTEVPVQTTQFGSAMEQVKLNVLAEASAEDEQFVNKVKGTLKRAAVKHTEVEEKRADFEKQKVDFASEVLQTEQQKNEHRAIEDKWANRERKRQYHYNGVKPIMMFVNIKDPLNLFLLYLLTFVLTPFFLLSKLIKGTIGALIAGASDGDRPKAVKGFLWTLVAVIAMLIITAVIYLFLKWQGLIY